MSQRHQHHARWVGELAQGVTCQTAFGWHQSAGAFVRLTPSWEGVTIAQAPPALHSHATATLTIRPTQLPQAWGVCLPWVAKHHTFTAPAQPWDAAAFVDEQVAGPFALWHHHHGVAATPRPNPQFEPPTSSTLTDTLRFALPLAPLTHPLALPLLQTKLNRLFRYRHTVTLFDTACRQWVNDALPKPLPQVLLLGHNDWVHHQVAAFLMGCGFQVRGASLNDADPDRPVWWPARQWLPSAQPLAQWLAQQAHPACPQRVIALPSAMAWHSDDPQPYHAVLAMLQACVKTLNQVQPHQKASALAVFPQSLAHTDLAEQATQQGLSSTTVAPLLSTREGGLLAGWRALYLAGIAFAPPTAKDEPAPPVAWASLNHLLLTLLAQVTSPPSQPSNSYVAASATTTFAMLSNTCAAFTGAKLPWQPTECHSLAKAASLGVTPWPYLPELAPAPTPSVMTGTLSYHLTLQATLLAEWGLTAHSQDHWQARLMGG